MMPSAGSANCTLTLAALSLNLADKLKLKSEPSGEPQ